MNRRLSDSKLQPLPTFQSVLFYLVKSRSGFAKESGANSQRPLEEDNPITAKGTLGLALTRAVWVARGVRGHLPVGQEEEGRTHRTQRNRGDPGSSQL